MYKILPSNLCTPENALKNLLQQFEIWLIESKKQNELKSWQGGHDEGTYLTAWREYFLHTQDNRIKEYAFRMFDHYLKWKDTVYIRGYYRKHEVHHGIEEFVIFLAWLYEMEPSHPGLKETYLAASANLLNPPENPPWFDFSTNRFTSLYIGTEEINPELTLNIPEHFRLVRLAWFGAACGGDPQLNDLIHAYITEWAELILNQDQIPVYLPPVAQNTNGDEQFQKALRKFIGAAPQSLTNETRSEFHIANGVPDLLLSYYEVTGKDLYRNAAEKILSPVLSQLNSPYAHPLGELVWRTHSLGGFSNINEIVESVQKDVDPFLTQSLRIGLTTRINWTKSSYFHTVGIRKDMAGVKIQGKSRFKSYMIPSPSTLGLIYRITRNPSYLSLGLQYANVILQDALHMFPEGRKHGCSARMRHSYCIGHGRNWGAGFTSTILRVAKGPSVFNITLPKMDKI
jgi:hypothetical protein